MDTPLLDTERQVLERYADAAQERESALCCPVQYDPKFLEAIPQEILDKDYGCGDPSRYVRQGDVVLDLGSGGGKICYIASQDEEDDDQTACAALARRQADIAGDQKEEA